MSDGDRVLSFAEELRRGCPLQLPPDDVAICDRLGCQERADLIVPGACLCNKCAGSFGIGVARLYDIPLQELLISDFRFIEARREQYRALLLQHRDRLLIPASEEHDETLDALIQRDIDALIRSCGGLP
jgi:hypothetical protein